MVNLTKTFAQYKKNSRALESDFNIEVEYDEQTDTVESIVKVWTYNYRDRSITDVSAIFGEVLSSQLEEMVSEIDWREVHSQSLTEAYG